MSEQSKAPEVIVASMMTGKWYDRPDGPTSLPEYFSKDHCNTLVGAAYQSAAKASYHNPSKEPDYPYDEKGALKRAYRDDFGDVKDPDGFAGQIALHDAWQAAQDILALTPADAQAAYDAALSAARAEGYAKGLEDARSSVGHTEVPEGLPNDSLGAWVVALEEAEKSILALKEQPNE